jgi:prolyl oligopeptidase
LEQGGVYVNANIRGGGEFGAKWHQAALKENRKLAYDDFIAVAEDLIRRNFTSTSKLAIRGGSNGGLLMGNMMVRRPDLFRSVICQVPLLDMKRYSHFFAGASWMAEYGDPDTSDWENYLHKYSAYHNLDNTQGGIRSFPSLLMTTSTKDDRVHPYHARAFIKRLEDLSDKFGCRRNDILYYENIEGGHGGAADNKQTAYVTVLYLQFLVNTIGPLNL